jgi:hypothetical protein
VEAWMTSSNGGAIHHHFILMTHLFRLSFFNQVFVVFNSLMRKFLLLFEGLVTLVKNLLFNFLFINGFFIFLIRDRT